MNAEILFYIGAFLTAAWGFSHLFPTKNVVRGFGEISIDNIRIITMEWIAEGTTLIFIGILIGAVTLIDPKNIVSHAVYWLSFSILNVMSLISLFTGFRNSFIAFKLCPFIFTGSSILILIGIFLN